MVDAVCRSCWGMTTIRNGSTPRRHRPRSAASPGDIATVGVLLLQAPSPRHQAIDGAAHPSTSRRSTPSCDTSTNAMPSPPASASEADIAPGSPVLCHPVSNVAQPGHSVVAGTFEPGCHLHLTANTARRFTRRRHARLTHTPPGRSHDRVGQPPHAHARNTTNRLVMYSASLFSKPIPAHRISVEDATRATRRPPLATKARGHPLRRHCPWFPVTILPDW